MASEVAPWWPKRRPTNVAHDSPSGLQTAPGWSKRAESCPKMLLRYPRMPQDALERTNNIKQS
eukprot:3448660-Pyramimonas_sp.AAC.1